MEGEGGGGPGWGRRAWSNRPFALQLSVWGVESVSRGPRKLRGARLDSRRLSNLICLWLKETDLHTYLLTYIQTDFPDWFLVLLLQQKILSNLYVSILGESKEIENILN